MAALYSSCWETVYDSFQTLPTSSAPSLPCGAEVGLLLSLFHAQKIMGSLRCEDLRGDYAPPSPSPTSRDPVWGLCPSSIVNMNTTSRRAWAPSFTWKMLGNLMVRSERRPVPG